MQLSHFMFIIMLIYFIFNQDALNMVVMKDLRSNKEGIDHAVIDVQMTMKESKIVIESSLRHEKG